MNGFALAACIYIASAALRDPRESSVELMSDVNEGCQCDGEVYSEYHPYETDSHNPGHLTVIGGVEMCPNEFWDRDLAGTCAQSHTSRLVCVWAQNVAA
jgi:hypothetical protein